MFGVQDLAFANCDDCGHWPPAYDPLLPDPQGPEPTGGDDVPHLAQVGYQTSSGDAYRFSIFGYDRSDCNANLTVITNNPNYSVYYLQPCTPAY